jgi:hypothetical protein
MKKSILAIAIMLSLTGNFAASQVLAMPDSSIITANCRAAQRSISQIEKADVVSRINRVRTYNNTQDLLFAMNARLSSNQIAAPRLVELTSDFKTQSAAFSASYNRYATELSRAINVDCVQKPVDFYARLINARKYRQDLADEIAKLNQIIDDYRGELKKVTEGLNEKN